MRKYLLLAGAALIGLGGSAYAAIDCAVPPTCEELGYVLTEDDCDGRATLTCPFDTSKVFCDVSCEDLGYPNKSENGETTCSGPTFWCPVDSNYYKCSRGETDLGDDVISLCKTLGYTKGGPSETGNLVVQNCLAGQEKVPCPYDSSYFRCDGEAAQLKDTCADEGYFLKGSAAANTCTYGHTSTGITADDGMCYRCCSASENTTGYQCLKTGYQ